MRIGVIGSRDWQDYSTLIRKIAIEIEDWARMYPEDKTLTFFHTGARGAETMVTEYVGKIEKLAKQNGKRISDTVIYSESSDRDRELAESSAMDKFLIFSKKGCKRTERFARMVWETEIPTVYIVE